MILPGAQSSSRALRWETIKELVAGLLARTFRWRTAMLGSLTLSQELWVSKPNLGVLLLGQGAWGNLVQDFETWKIYCLTGT